MIYFIQAGEDGPIKIGCSDHLQSRMRNLQSYHYQELNLLGTMPGNVDTERKLHLRFAADRVRGEWFQPIPEIFDFVRRHCNQGKTNTVQLFDDGECRIIFAQPLKATKELIIFFGTHQVKLLSDEELGYVFGIEGKPAVVEDLLVTKGIDDHAVDEFRRAFETD